MFTGIITDIGTVAAIDRRGDLRVTIACGYDLDTVELGASIACSGVCLTVVDKAPAQFSVDVSAETMARSAPLWAAGTRLNLERALKLGDELGGHIVTGHVDGVGTVTALTPEGGSLRVTIAAPPDLAPYLAEKGSITLDGISLTVNAVRDTADTVEVSVNIIPHTAAVTSFADLAIGRRLNIEIDVLARYLGRMASLARADAGQGPL